ncbi:hypothetical protein [Nisaea denitrificans]|uniref:hypothetical protein n=1 Tax=Nisaea denitrificans TaxID=390877 RepID=UPI00041F1D55|nr:hypothetical protein [Nisaea denitrificans]
MSGSLKSQAKGCIGAAALVAGIVSFVAPASALDPRLCTQHGDLVNQLGKKYGEAVSASGFDGAGNFVQVFSSKTGSWTIAVSTPGGQTCVISAGNDWQKEESEPPKPEVAS